MSTRGAGGSAAKRRAGGGRESAAAGEDEGRKEKKKKKKTVKRYLDYLPEVLIEHALSYVGVRDLEVARYAGKMVNVVARRFLPLWIGVAPLVVGDSVEGSAANELPAHIKGTLEEALAAFQRFREVGPTGRSLEIRLVDNSARVTGWEVGPGWNRVPGKIGGGEYSGLNLDGENRWQGLRIVTSEVEVVYGDGSQYSVLMKESVTSIGGSAFYGCSGLTSVTFPGGLTSIGGGAFYECSGLTSVAFPEGLTSIEVEAFYGCTGLTSVTFPEGLTSIGVEAFQGCTGLTSASIPDGAQLGSGAFSSDTRVSKKREPLQ